MQEWVLAQEIQRGSPDHFPNERVGAGDETIRSVVGLKLITKSTNWYDQSAKKKQEGGNSLVK